MTDRNGVLIARNIKVYHAAIKPNLIKDKKIYSKLKLLYPELDVSKIKKFIRKNIFILNKT